MLNLRWLMARVSLLNALDIEGNNTTLVIIRSQFDVVEGDPFNPRRYAKVRNGFARSGSLAPPSGHPEGSSLIGGD
jgi:hypothetical protein